MPDSVLIVDDDLSIQDTVKDILEDAGFEVATAGTCADALLTLQNFFAKTVVVDFNLPDGLGLELAAKLKNLRPDVKLILMTGESAFNLGNAHTWVQAVLMKPVSPALLIETIRKP